MNNVQLEKLFHSSEIVWTGDLYNPKNPANSVFFCINPLRSIEERKNENVSQYRNFLFEFDGVPLDAQYKALEQLKQSLPIATAVYSGSKSVHLIISMADTLTHDYRQAWLALSSEITYLTNLIADPSCKNPARLSRLAGSVRPDTGKEQTLLYSGPLLKNAVVTNLINKYGLSSTGSGSRPSSEIDPDMSVEDFELKLKNHKGLLKKIRSVVDWAGPINMYPELLKLTLWAIDSTGVPQSTFTKFAEDNLFKHLIAAGYPEEKLYKPIDNAYSYKF
jgi:hypothetical protein